jgi:hypothetical protein
MNDRIYKTVPFLVCVKDLSDEQINDMVDTLHSDFGGAYFRGRDIYMEVLEDFQKEAQDTMKFQHGPYVGLRINNKEGFSIDLKKKVPGGYAVYGHDQFLEMAKNPKEFLAKALEGKIRKHHDSGLGMS